MCIISLCTRGALDGSSRGRSTAALYGVNKVGDTLTHFGGNEALVRALLAHHVEFMVIGGLAVSWYSPERQADDMDLLVNPTVENSERLCSALSSLGLSGFSPVSFSRVGIQVPLKNQQFYAELLTPKKDGPGYAECSAGAVQGKLFGFPVVIVGLEALIRLKEHAVQKHESASTNEPLEKHRQDLGRLRALRGHAV
jgi:predicted nucleotidyltransferase